MRKSIKFLGCLVAVFSLSACGGGGGSSSSSGTGNTTGNSYTLPSSVSTTGQ